MTEALPVSSSAHLVIVPWLFGWRYQGLSFDVALHLGTALAFIVYFWNDWIRMIKTDTKLLWCIVLGTIPAAVAGVLLEKEAETVFRSPLVMLVMLAVFALILWWADYYGKKRKSLAEVDIKSALAIGLAQVLALIPGVSRSGITITAGLARGFSREAAARFSFLLATPVVLAAGVLKLPKLQHSDLTVSFWAGIFFSALSGFIGIHFLLNFVRRSSFKLFVFYRIALAAVVLAVLMLRK